MATEQVTGAESGGSDPSTFNFSAYIAGTSTFPTFDHTAYLDQQGGIQLHRVADQYDKLAARGREIQRKQEMISEAPTRSLVDEEAEDLTAELAEIEKKCAELEPEIERLRTRVMASALKLHFQSGTAQKLGQVVRQAEKEFHKKHSKKDDSDVEYITAKSKALLVAQLAAYCTGVTLADGTRQDAPDEKGFSALLDSLISSESVRLMTCLNQNLDSSAEWADRIDAGFPGGRDQQAPQPLGDPVVADLAGLVGAPADHPDGGGDQLDG